MTELNQQRCEACRVGAPLIGEAEAQQRLSSLDGWRLVSVDGVLRLTKSYTLPNFRQALAFTNRVGAMAEEQGHHPDIVTRWGEVELSWWTHKIKGLHHNDFICAARSDALYTQG